MMDEKIKVGDEVEIIPLSTKGVVANTFFATTSNLNYQVIYGDTIRYFSRKDLKKI